MALLKRLFYILAVHAAAYAAYPDTGAMIKVYAWCSILGWALLIIILHYSIQVKAARLLVALGDLLLIAAVALVVSVSMPQRDKVSVLDKLRAGKYPTFGQVKGGVTQIGGEIKDAAETLEKTGKEIKMQVEQARSAQKEQAAKPQETKKKK